MRILPDHITLCFGFESIAAPSALQFLTPSPLIPFPFYTPQFSPLPMGYSNLTENFGDNFCTRYAGHCV